MYDHTHYEGVKNIAGWLAYKIKDYYDGHNGGFKSPIIHYPPLLSTLNQ